MPKRMPTKECAKCGETFPKSAEYSYVVWAKIKFCSRKCMGAARTKTVTPCRHCGEPGNPVHPKRPFCSQSCYFAFLRTTRFPLVPRKSKLFSKPMKRILLERANHQCEQCGNTENLEFDHVIPIHLGGDGTLENGQILCVACHLDKTLTERRALERVA